MSPIRDPLSSRPSPPSTSVQSEWTVVTRLTRKSARFQTSPRAPASASPKDSQDPLHSAEGEQTPLSPPPPDDDATLATLHEHYQRCLARWRSEIADNTGLASEWQAVVERIPPADATWRLETVVLVALGRLSNSWAWFDAAAADAEAQAGSVDSGTSSTATMSNSSSSKTKKRATRMAISGGSPRDTCMRQLVALESWIATLQAKGHFTALPMATKTPSSSSRGGSGECLHDLSSDEIQSSYVTPTRPLAGCKIVQDPLINVLDAAFLTDLGWTVLPSTRSACRAGVAAKTSTTSSSSTTAAAAAAAEVATATTSSSSSAARAPAPASAVPEADLSTPAQNGDSASDDARLDNAAAHLSPSTLLFAPHAPHGLVRWLLGAREGPTATEGDRLPNDEQPSESPSSHQSQIPSDQPPRGFRATDTYLRQPGVYIGNEVSRIMEWKGDRADEGASAAGSAEEHARLQAWLAVRRAETTSSPRRWDALDGILSETWVYTYTGSGAMHATESA